MRQRQGGPPPDVVHQPPSSSSRSEGACRPDAPANGGRTRGRGPRDPARGLPGEPGRVAVASSGRDCPPGPALVPSQPASLPPWPSGGKGGKREGSASPRYSNSRTQWKKETKRCEAESDVEGEVKLGEVSQSTGFPVVVHRLTQGSKSYGDDGTPTGAVYCFWCSGVHGFRSAVAR